MILTITNQKGGVGKTTITHTLSYGLARRGYKVLVVDLDGQCSLTRTFRIDPELPTSYDLMLKKARIKECIQPVEDNLDIIPGDPDLSAMDLELKDLGKEYRLKEVLEPVKSVYDFIILDTPPALNTITTNALTGADRVLIPCVAEVYSLDGVGRLYDTINVIRKYTNKDLIIDGMLLNEYNSRTILSREIANRYKKLAESIGTKVYTTTIRTANAMKETQTRRKDIFTYDGKSNVANDCNEFIDEFLKGLGYEQNKTH